MLPKYYVKMYCQINYFYNKNLIHALYMYYHKQFMLIWYLVYTLYTYLTLYVGMNFIQTLYFYLFIFCFTRRRHETNLCNIILKKYAVKVMLERSIKMNYDCTYYHYALLTFKNIWFLCKQIKYYFSLTDTVIK